MSKFEQYLAEAALEEKCDGDCKCGGKEKGHANGKDGKCDGKCSCKDCKCKQEADEDDGNKKFTRRELADKFGVPESEIKTNAVKGHSDLWVFYKDGKPQTYKKA